ncbi:MAG: hypothetical protein PHE33_04030 [Bacteroidales bacterium]|nr:hypothetical protein [Bacteroidales bacterium]
MKITTKTFLKLFFLNFLLFGGAMALSTYFLEGETVLLKELIQALLFSDVLAAVSVNIRIHTRNKKKNAPITEEDLNLAYSETIATKLSIHDIYAILKANSFGKEIKIDSENLKISGKTRMSIFSWGSKITISSLNDKIKIKSKPLFEIQFLNNKKNKKNVSLIIDMIESNNPSL